MTALAVPTDVRYHAAPASDDAVRAGPQDPGEPVFAGAGSPGGMNHSHACRQADGEGGKPSRRAHEAGTHIPTFIVYLESVPHPSGSSAAAPRRTLTSMLLLPRVMTKRD